VPPASEPVTVYRISNWGQTYEDNRTRGRTEIASVPVPVRDERYAFMTADGGAELFGVYSALVLVSALCVPRGYLVISDGSGAFAPHTAETLAAATGIGRGCIERGIASLAGAGIILRVPVTPDVAAEIRGANRMIFARKPRHKLYSICGSSVSRQTGSNFGRGCNRVGQTVPSYETPLFNEHAFQTPLEMITSEVCTNGAAVCQQNAPGKSSAPGRIGDHAALVDYWCGKWAERYGVQYKFSGRDAKHVKEILAPPTNLPGAKLIVDRYLADPEPYLARRGHPLGLLISQINRWRVVAVPADGIPDECAPTEPDDPRLPTAEEARAFLRGPAARPAAPAAFSVAEDPTEPAAFGGPQNSFGALGGEA
jgi:hypothetical protein